MTENDKYEEFFNRIETINKNNQTLKNIFSKYDKKAQDEIEDSVEKLLNQRNTQREKIFNFVIWYTALATLFYFALLGIQVWMRIFCNADWLIMSEKSFIYFTIAIFVHLLGLVYLITRSLYNESSFIGLHKKWTENK